MVHISFTDSGQYTVSSVRILFLPCCWLSSLVLKVISSPFMAIEHFGIVFFTLGLKGLVFWSWLVIELVLLLCLLGLVQGSVM